MPVTELLLALLLITIALTVVYVLYRQKVEVSLGREGVKTSEGEMIAWEDMEWYAINTTSIKREIRQFTLKYKGQKIVWNAECDDEFLAFEKIFKQLVQTHNPLAVNYKDLSDKDRAIYGTYYAYHA